MSNRVVITLSFHRQRGLPVTNVEVDSETGCMVRVDGPLFPVDLAVVSEVVEAVRSRKDTYHAARIVEIRRGTPDDHPD